MAATDNKTELRLALTNDQGRPIESPVEICRVVGLDTVCSDFGAEELESPLTLPGDFASLRIEGPNHGPVLVQRRRLTKDEDGVYRVTIARKARLRIQGVPPEGLTISLYEPTSPQFRRPWFRQLLSPGEDGDGIATVPSGNYVLTLSAPGTAPALFLQELPPATTRTVSWRSRQGWSLLLRLVSATTGDPVPEARVHVEAMEGVASAPAPARTTRSNAAGLAVVSALTPPLAQARIEHLDYVEASATALSATPGGFAFREVPLSRGGTLRAEVFLHEEPLPGVHCTLQQRLEEPPYLTPATEVRGDASGTCRTRKLPAGSYLLEVRPGDEDSRLQRPVEILDGVEVVEHLELNPIELGGTVWRGSEPAAGLTVEVLRSESHRLQPVTRAATDEDGHYQARLWEGGTFTLLVETASGAAGSLKRASLTGPEETVDFHLSPQGISGIVIDEEGAPVDQATVRLTWDGLNHSLAGTDQSGAFLFPVGTEATVEVAAFKKGFRSSEIQRLEVAEGTEPPPLTLVLRRLERLRGTLRSPTGQPLPAVWVASRSAVVPAASDSTLTASDGTFELPRPADVRALRIFATGPGCPLTAFPVAPGNEPLDLVCDPEPASLVAELVDADAKPMAGVPLLLRRQGIVIPRDVLQTHLSRLGLRTETGADGRAILAALRPGVWEVFLGGAHVSEPEVAAGGNTGHLATVNLLPRATEEVRVTLDRPR